jgi:hypothetical protein
VDKQTLPARVVGHLMLFSSRADYSSARTLPDKSRASPRSLRTTASFSQSVPGVGAKCRSSAPHGWSVRCSCLPVGADLRERPSGSSPKSRCRITPRGNFGEYAPKACDKSARPGCRSRKPPLGECADTKPAKSSVCAAFQRRMTTAHPVPGSLLWRLEQAFAPKEAIQPLFLSQLVTVLRETPKMRLIPRREARS